MAVRVSGRPRNLCGLVVLAVVLNPGAAGLFAAARDAGLAGAALRAGAAAFVVVAGFFFAVAMVILLSVKRCI